MKIKKILSSLVVVFLFFELATPAFAASYYKDATTQESKPALVTVGNAVIQNTSNNELVKTGEDLRTAFEKCGYAYQSDCVINDLKTKGYTDQQVSSYRTRVGNAQAECGNGGYGVPCLGFVAIIGAIVSGDTNSFGGNANDYYSKQSISFGSYTYKRLNPNEPIGAGDIGASAMGSYGHILIVKSVDQGSDQFIGLESNANSDCRVTNNIPRPIDRDLYAFFRKQ
ncbi:MAG: hypothetical protein M1450_02755 [Patescibacteria group bacterium]|nr:hypothetical protein [Patescibacteria group bacterium]